MEQSKKIIVDGMSFVASGRPYYYNSNTRTYLHRYLWEKAYGKIPEGYEIHHKDHNPDNNELENLELISVEEHQKHHADNLTEERREFMRRNMEEKARPAAIEWHGSREGREWHKEHYENTKDKLHAKTKFVCEMCNKEFEAVNNGLNRFCSNGCKSKWRRLNGLDNVVRKCQWCGKEFETSKFKKVSHCSRSCTNRTIHKNRKLKDSPNLQE